MFPVWAMALIAAAITAVVVASLGGVGQAQPVGAADLSITKTIKPDVVTVGQTQTYTIQINNKTGSRAMDVQMRDPLPRNVKFIRASTSRQVPGSCGARSGTVTCDLGNLQVNQGVTVKIYVKTTEAGRYKNTAFVTHSTTELDATNNSDSARHRAVEKDRDGGGGKHHCGVKAGAGNGGARACVGGVKAGA